MLVMLALARTSVSGILSCHLIFINFLRQTVQISHAQSKAIRMTAMNTFRLVSVLNVFVRSTKMVYSACVWQQTLVFPEATLPLWQ